MSDWPQVGSPPEETSALLMARKFREAGTPTDERQNAGFDAPLAAVSKVVLVAEPAPEEARRPPGDTVGLGLW